MRRIVEVGPGPAPAGRPAQSELSAQRTWVQVQAELPTTFVPRQRLPSAPSPKTARVCGDTGRMVAAGEEVRTPPTRWKALHVDLPATRVLIQSAASVPRTNRSV